MAGNCFKMCPSPTKCNFICNKDCDKHKNLICKNECLNKKFDINQQIEKKFESQEKSIKFRKFKNNNSTEIINKFRNKMKKIKQEENRRGIDYPSWSSGFRSDSISGFSSMSLGGSSEVSRCGLKRINRKTYLNAFLCGKSDAENDVGLYEKYRDNNPNYLGNHTGG